jgi:hypothetical protein
MKRSSTLLVFQKYKIVGFSVFPPLMEDLIVNFNQINFLKIMIICSKVKEKEFKKLSSLKKKFRIINGVA